MLVRMIVIIIEILIPILMLVLMIIVTIIVILIQIKAMFLSMMHGRRIAPCPPSGVPTAVIPEDSDFLASCILGV